MLWCLFQRNLNIFEIFSNQTKFKIANPLVWSCKNNLGVTPTMYHITNYQFVWHLYSDESAKLDTSITNEMFAVMEINAPDGRQAKRLHMWQKPDELALRLIRQTTKTGDLVVDTFTCTGTFLIAAGKLGRIGKGCDNDQKNLDIAISRGCQPIKINSSASTTMDNAAQTIIESEDKFTSSEDNLIQDTPKDKPDEDTNGLLELDGDIEKVD